MTDRHSGYVVVLDENIREDDAQVIIDALKMIKGVKDVVPVVSTPMIAIAATRERVRMRQKLIDLVQQLDKD